MSSSRPNIKILRFNNPLMLFILLPILLVGLVFFAIFMFGSLALGPRRRISAKKKSEPEIERQTTARERPAQATKAQVIDADYRVIT